MVDRLVLITISDQHGVNKDGKIPYCAHSMFATKEFILLHPLAKVFKMALKIQRVPTLHAFWEGPFGTLKKLCYLKFVGLFVVVKTVLVIFVKVGDSK